MEKRSIRHTTMLAACLGCFSCLVSTFIFADPSSQVVRLSYLNGTLSFLSFKERQQILLKNGSNPWSPLQSYKMATKKNFNDVFQKVEPKNKKNFNDVFQKVEPKNKKNFNDVFQKVEPKNKKSINDVFQKVEPKNKKSINDIFQKVESDNPI